MTISSLVSRNLATQLEKQDAVLESPDSEMGLLPIYPDLGQWHKPAVILEEYLVDAFVPAQFGEAERCC